MPTYTVTDPTTNKSVDLEGDSPPTEQELNGIFSQVHGGGEPKSFGGLMKNAGADIKANVGALGRIGQGLNDLPSDIYQSGKQVLSGGDYNQTPLMQDARTISGAITSAPKAIFNQYRDIAAQPLKYIPGQVGQEFQKAYPENPFYQHPVNTALALLPFAKPAAAAASEIPGVSEASNAVGNAVKGVQNRVLPPLLKSTKGIPTNATRMAIDNPDVLDLPGTSASIQGKSQDIIDTIKEADRKVGKEFGQAYKEQGMNSPIDEIVNGNTPYKPILGKRTYQSPGDLVNKTENIPGYSYETTQSELRPVQQTVPGYSYKSSSGYPETSGINPNEITSNPESQSVNVPGRNYTSMEEANKTGTVNVPGRSYTYTEEGAPQSIATSEIKNTVPNIPPSKSIDELRNDYQSAMRGDLFKSQNKAGGLETMPDQEKLSTLTDLKRSLQDQAVYPQPGQQLSPSQGAQNAAIKKMAADIDNLRGTIPGGDKLAVADDAYVEMKELFHRLTSAFKDPYTGQDYLNRILKGNTDWLTSGRMAGKVGAIERIEQMTGKQVLQPALKEMAAAYINNPDIMSLPGFKLSSLISAFIPTKTLLRGLKLNVPKSIFNAAPASPALLGQPPQSSIPEVSPANKSPIQFKQAAQAPMKKIDEQTARDYLDKANGNKDQARAMAKADGWTVS